MCDLIALRRGGEFDWCGLMDEDQSTRIFARWCCYQSGLTLLMMMLLLQSIPLLLLPLTINSSSYFPDCWCDFSWTTMTDRSIAVAASGSLSLSIVNCLFPCCCFATAAAADWNSSVPLLMLPLSLVADGTDPELWWNRLMSSLRRSINRRRWSVLCRQSQQSEKNRRSAPLKNQVNALVVTC